MIRISHNIITIIYTNIIINIMKVIIFILLPFTLCLLSRMYLNTMIILETKL